MDDSRIDPVQNLLQHATNLPILQALTTALPYLSETETALAQYLLTHLRHVAGMNAAETAAAAGVSEATLYRLCRHLGLGGYAPLREGLAQAGTRYSPGFSAPINVRQKDDSDMSELQWGAYFGMRALLDACSVDDHALHDAAKAITRARRISVTGIGFLSAGLAQMTAVALQRLGLTCMLWTDHHSMPTESTIFEAGDVVLALSHSGESTTLVRFVQSAAQAGATVIAVTNRRQSSLASTAHVCLVTNTREKTETLGDLLPRVPQLLVVQVLINMIRNEINNASQRETN